MPNETAEWTRYSDIECEIIEDSFRSSEATEVALDLYLLDLIHKVQVNKQDYRDQRPIKRVVCENELDFRKERFCLSLPLLPVDKTADDDNVFRSGFGWKWYWKHYGKKPKPLLGRVAELAADGIEIEGEKIGKSCEAKWIANKLRNKKTASELTIIKYCLSLYTRDSFIYNLIVQENDQSKLDTLGCFYFLLHNQACAVLYEKYGYKDTVYLSMSLDSEQLKCYRELIGRKFCWPRFSSATKNREKLEHVDDQNTLFIITFDQFYSGGLDISSFSSFPNEQEVLLRPR
ncbi:unnamed protein product, partial [Didymodactylos carnosus]